MTSTKALTHDAAQLHMFEFSGKAPLLGFNTIDSIKGGIVNAWSFIVDGYIERIKSAYNIKDLKVFITGGDSKIILSSLKAKVEPVKNLVFKGLESLYELNR